MRRLALAAALTGALAAPLLLVTPAAAQMVTLSPEQIGQIFCISRLGNDMAPTEGLLTAALEAAIDVADAKNDAWEDANPGDKPPLGDGIPWQAWPDYAAQCTVGATTLMMDEAKVEIDYGFPDAPGANFTDTLLLQLVPGEYDEKVWRIDNIAYGTESDLQALLLNVFMEN